MTPLGVTGSHPGRELHFVAGLGILAAAGALPLRAGDADVCVLGPLVHGPVRGQVFREHRARQRLTG